MKQIGDKVSYVKNPFARSSYYGLVLSLAGWLLGGTGMYLSVINGGQGGLNTGAFGFSSILSAIMGLWYSFKSFSEKERNYILAKIGFSISLGLLILWVVIIITGL